MDDVTSRIWADLIGRIHGPMTFRLILQPAMAIYFAVRDGLHDGRSGRAPYLWTLVTEPQERRWMLQEGWKAIGRIIVLAVAMDVAYQLIVFHTIYPFEIVLVTLILAVLPYCVLRGLIGRVFGRKAQ